VNTGFTPLYQILTPGSAIDKGFITNGGLDGPGEVNRRILRRGLKHDGIKGCAPDMDATAIKATKRPIHRTYKGSEQVCKKSIADVGIYT